MLKIIYTYIARKQKNVFIGLISKLDMTEIRIMGDMWIRISKNCDTILKNVTNT